MCCDSLDLCPSVPRAKGVCNGATFHAWTGRFILSRALGPVWSPFSPQSGPHRGRSLCIHHSKVRLQIPVWTTHVLGLSYCLGSSLLYGTSTMSQLFPLLYHRARFYLYCTISPLPATQVLLMAVSPFPYIGIHVLGQLK